MKCHKHDENVVMKCWICANERSFLEYLFDKKAFEPKGTMIHEHVFTSTPIIPDPPIKWNITFT